MKEYSSVTVFPLCFSFSVALTACHSEGYGVAGLTGGSGSSWCPRVGLDPVPATVTVGPDLFQHVQDPHLSAGLALVLLGVDDVVEGSAGSGFGLSAAACCCGALRIPSASPAAWGLVQNLDQEGDAARLPHGNAAVLRAGQSQQSAGHLFLISVSEHGE